MFKLASSIGFALALADLKQRIRRKLTQGMFGAVGGMVFLFGFTFLLIALHLWLSRLLNPVASAAIIGVVLMLIALLLFVIAGLKGRAPASAPRAGASPFPDAASSVAGALGEGLSVEALLKSPLLPLAGIALIAGILLGKRKSRDNDGDDD